MKIGELAARTHTKIETVRYYEREGLLPKTPRTLANYRVYGAAHVERLAFIRHCRALDMTLDEIRALLRFKDEPTADCGGVDALLDEHIGHVAARIRELRQLEKTLKSLRQQCSGAQTADRCGILGRLSELDAAQEGQTAVAHVRRAHRHP